MHYLRVGLEFVGGVAVHDRALFHDEHALAQLVGGLHVLLDEQDRRAAPMSTSSMTPFSLRHFRPLRGRAFSYIL